MILDCEHKDGGRCGRNQIPFQTKQLQQGTLLERNLLDAAGPGGLLHQILFPLHQILFQTNQLQLLSRIYRRLGLHRILKHTEG